MPSDPFYQSREWRDICAIVKERSRGMCEVAGCDEHGKVVDHIVSRRNGGRDHHTNMRHLCRRHDNQVKEKADGTRKSNGVFKLIGCDADGWPKSLGVS